MTPDFTPALPLRRRLAAALAFLTTSSLCGAAAAHVTLETRRAPVDSSYKAVFNVGHGCAGQATHTVVVQIPAGFRGAKPQPKAGWAVSMQRARLAVPYNSHGREVTEDVTEIRWAARGPEAQLPDDQFDEFVLRGQLPASPGPLWFKVQQVCPTAQLDWVEQPATGTSTRGLKAPAVLLEVEPAPGAPAHVH